MTEQKLLALSTYSRAEAFSTEEKLVLELTDALTATPANVSSEMFEELSRVFSPKQLVELSSAIAWENYRARNNRVFDVGSEDYSEGAFCPMPVGREAPDAHPFDIHVGYKSVRYSEGDDEMLFSREPSFGSLPSIVWIPSRERWALSAPAWAQNRREEIIARVKAATPADKHSQSD